MIVGVFLSLVGMGRFVYGILLVFVLFQLNLYDLFFWVQKVLQDWQGFIKFGWYQRRLYIYKQQLGRLLVFIFEIVGIKIIEYKV